MKGRIVRQFNRSAAAGSYDVHAHVQRVMAEWLIETVGGGPDRLDVLEIGCGTGLFTELLAQRCPRSTITAIDIAPAMLAAAEERLAACQSVRSRIPVRFVQADIEIWAGAAPPASFDFIVSNACFQWLARPGDTLRSLTRLLRPGGVLAFATFGPETFREMHQAFEEAYRLLGAEPRRHGLELHAAEQWTAWLNAGGYSDIHSRRDIRVEEHPAVRDFLHSVKSLGASASEASSSPGFLRRLFRDMFAVYEEKFRLRDGISATYELLLLQATLR
ncbi:malonyl-ACP O-methyltransferase BioC [Cohnella sp. CFH 77786]|uniref:malonyl-ACP O-methyltransferase BioC n=1 Tax=Cohnella sp. CFH 77786 TaxID=2662265 RepID=UPI001C60DA74|nr:malonyl-ACP O-methyltransferase BioC [Cohnella sp. CFH 77786]MBW5448861.1 malonyl-ACP O-methyltransferase BioC [Cohnella sp. CFH 77786]